MFLHYKLFSDLSKNTGVLTEALETEAPTYKMATLIPPRDVTRILRNCTSTVEETYTVPLDLGICATNYVPEFNDNNNFMIKH